MKKYIFVFIIVFTIACSKENTNYEPTWESLSRHNQAPEWFTDAKLGIYFHWGVYSVPAYGSEWYPRRMYQNDGEVAKYHRETFGAPEEFNYHDFVPMFKAEKFDAADWVQLFKNAGAKFSGPVAQHHDGFAMWASAANPWNVKDKGPKRDITGELTKELRDNDLKLITTFHHARHLQRYKNKPEQWGGWHSHFVYNPKFATSSEDPELRKLYGNMDEAEWDEYWFKQLKEVIDQYNPDIIWFDAWLNMIPENNRQKFAAYYLNEAKKKNQEVVIAYKQNDMPLSVGVKDIEQGGKKELAESVWLTDVTISYGSWCFTNGQTYKDAGLVVRNMIDVWSKNGVVLLNVSPKADGSIPQEQRDCLNEIGDWMKTYGEAVYDTRPWTIYGFGSANALDGKHEGQSATTKYSASDIRFTRTKDNNSIFIFFLGKPKVGEEIEIEWFKGESHPVPSPIKKITEMSSGKLVEWRDIESSFFLTIPDAPMNELATVFKIELE